MALKLIPHNKYVWLEPIDEANKIGNLFVPGNTSNQYRIGVVKAISQCDEGKDIKEGDRVLYDTVGSVSHRIGNQTVVTVKVLNILCTVQESL